MRVPRDEEPSQLSHCSEYREEGNLLIAVRANSRPQAWSHQPEKFPWQAHQVNWIA
jgi:hypothetical protein